MLTPLRPLSLPHPPTWSATPPLADPPGVGPARELPTHWRRLVEQWPDGCLWLDPADGRLLGANQALLQRLGQSRDQLAGRPLSLLAPPALDASAAATWALMARAAPLRDADIEVRAADGRRLPTSASATQLFDRAGRPLCGLLVWRDTTRHAQQAGELRDGQVQLQALAHELSLLEVRERERLATTLHDGIGQLLSLARIKLHELGTVDGRAAAALRDTLDELLAAALRSTRETTFELAQPLLEPLGLQRAIEALARQLSHDSGLAVTLHGALAAPPLPPAAPAVLLRVLRELLHNLHKHAGARRAWIRLDDDGQLLRIEVGDDGRGFDAAGLPAAAGPGGGYGLASARAQLRALGGLLRLASAPGRGCRVTLRLPRPAAASPGSPPP